ncbi:MAG: tetratricopeptide repeat protein [Xanthomonadales bacterium]|nr:tetratricopeptide repeat protein [Xanthomonadales bacterium]
MGKDVKAREILERSARQMESELSDQPELKAQLLATIAEGQRALGLVEAATASAQQAVHLVAGTGSSAERFARLALARSHIRDRNIPAARAELKLIREMSRTPVERMELLLEEQGLTIRLGDFDKAQLRYEAALASDLFDAAVSEELRIRIKLAQVPVLQMVKKQDEALDLARDAYVDAQHSRRSDLLVQAGFRLISALRSVGEFDQAIDKGRETVELARSTYGKGHSVYADALTVYANALSQSGRAEETIPIRHEVIEITTALFGADSLNLLSLRNNLANSLARSGRMGEAVTIFRALAAEAQVRLPDESPSYQHYSQSLAEALLAEGELDEAIEVIDRAIADAIKVSDSSVMDSYINSLNAMKDQAENAISQQKD